VEPIAVLDDGRVLDAAAVDVLRTGRKQRRLV
jgi:hypothetical protein